MDISSDGLRQTEGCDSDSDIVCRALLSSHIGKSAQSSANTCDRSQRMMVENLQRYEQWQDLITISACPHVGKTDSLCLIMPIVRGRVKYHGLACR